MLAVVVAECIPQYHFVHISLLAIVHCNDLFVMYKVRTLASFTYQYCKLTWTPLLWHNNSYSFPVSWKSSRPMHSSSSLIRYMLEWINSNLCIWAREVPDPDTPLDFQFSHTQSQLTCNPPYLGPVLLCCPSVVQRAFSQMLQLVKVRASSAVLITKRPILFPAAGIEE